MPEAIEKRLLSLVRQLPKIQAEQLLEFAEFLVGRYPLIETATEPLPIPRPPEESVIKAIKRLSATYPMLNPTKMLDETSYLVTQHVVQGRAATEVIDELEALFRRHHEAQRGA
jgi:hypothetical protein